MEMLNKIEAELICHMFFDGPVWDGNLISKQGRDELVDAGLAERGCGYQWLTQAGVQKARELGFTDMKTGRHPLASEVWKRVTGGRLSTEAAR